MEIRFGTLGAGGGASFQVEYHIYTDDTNKVVGPLGAVPQSLSDVAAFWEPVLQFTPGDFVVRPVSGGSAPGYYLCVSPSSSAPGGGTFAGGVNPTTGMDSFAVAGETFVVMYQPA